MSVVPIRKREDIDLILDALHRQHREQMGKMATQLTLYRKTLVDHGIEPPDRDGEWLLQHWKDCAAIISAVSEFVHHMGTQNEMLSDDIADAVARARRPA